MSWPARYMSPRMMDALREYTETTATMVDVCERHGVSRRGLSAQIKTAGASRRPNIIARGGGNLAGKTGESHPAWKRGYTIDHDGYILTYAPNHPFPRANGQIKEHMRVMELRLGRRLLPGENTHHKDLNRLNNADDNLVLMSTGEHSRLHRLIEASLGFNRHDRSMSASKISR